MNGTAMALAADPVSAFLLVVAFMARAGFATGSAVRDTVVVTAGVVRRARGRMTPDTETGVPGDLPRR